MELSTRELIDRNNAVQHTIRQIGVTRISNTIIRNHTTEVSNGLNYTVGSHIGGAVQLLLLLYPDASPNLIRHVAFHDYPEFETGDIIGSAKSKHPELDRVLAEIEEAVEKEYKILEGYLLSSEEEQVLKIVDRLELLIWCENQHKMGCRTDRFMAMYIRVGQTTKKLLEVLDLEVSGLISSEPFSEKDEELQQFYKSIYEFCRITSKVLFHYQYSAHK